MSKYIMFLDETGTSDINKGKYFTLCGVIFEHKIAFDDLPLKISPLKKKIDEFKLDCFGRNNFLFHLLAILDISKPFRKEDGVSLPQIRDFWSKLPTFLGDLDFKIISVTVDKIELKKFYNTPKDPYAVAFAHILEAFYSFLGNDDVETARIVVESRDENQNLVIQKAFFDIFNTGTQHLEFEKYKNKLKGFVFAEKDNKHYQSGLEIADLVCHPLSRSRQGLIEVDPRFIEYGSENKIFTAIKSKIYVPNSDDDFRNWGFKLVPIMKNKKSWTDNPIVLTN